MLKVIVIRYSFVIRSLLWLIRFAVRQLNEDISTLQKLPADLRQTEAARSGLSAPLSERRGVHFRKEKPPEALISQRFRGSHPHRGDKIRSICHLTTSINRRFTARRFPCIHLCIHHIIFPSSIKRKFFILIRTQINDLRSRIFHCSIISEFFSYLIFVCFLFTR